VDSFNAVGDYTKDLYADGSLQKIAIHSMVGGLLSQVSGGDFRTGALAAGANEAMVNQLKIWVSGDQNLLNMSSQLVGMLAAATQSGADAESLQKGAWVAENATQYNHDNHLNSVEEVDRDLRKELGEHVPPAEQEALGDESLHIDLPPPGVSGILRGQAKEMQIAGQRLL
jgi:filamentous hemagglutinin